MRNLYYIAFILFAVASLTGCRQKRNRPNTYHYSAPSSLSDNISVANAYDYDVDTLQLVKMTKLILSDTIPNIHSLLILKDEHLVYENYFDGTDEKLGKKLGYIPHSRDDLHDCRSITKSITSACIGLDLQKGLIKSIDTPIYTYFAQKYDNKFDKNICKMQFLPVVENAFLPSDFNQATLMGCEVKF